MKGSWLVLPVLAFMMVGCSSDPTPGSTQGTVQAPAPPPAASNDGVTLASQTPSRVTGTYAASGNTIRFDLAKVGTDVFADILGNGDRPILHLETTGDSYDFTYMGGGLTLHTTKGFVANAQAQAQANPGSVSSADFQFVGDMHVLDEMLALPEVALFPNLSRALGVRGITGSDYPASLVLHKVGRQAADALGARLAPLDTAGSANGYCQAYPNSGDSCYGMCGPGCSCWSWVCGDCCYHYGCAVHDSWCREGEWYYCYDITAVIALFGC
jgi:hypothetical protein